LELFEEIRRGVRGRRDDQRTGEEARSATARMVRQADRRCDPPNRRKHAREQPKLDPVKEAIDRMLEGDRQAPRKQRHNGAPDLDAAARRNIPAIPSPSRPYGDTCSAGSKNSDWRAGKCSCRRATTGARKVQVDWFEAVAKLDGEPLQACMFFAMRSMASGDAFPSGLHERDAASVAGSARTCLRLFRRRVWQATLRQPWRRW